MRHIIIFVVLLLSTLCATFTQTQDSESDSKEINSKSDAVPQMQTISVGDFGAKSVIGHLGHPLGTVVRATGIAVDGDTTRLKRDVGTTLLEIQTVNGDKLEKKVLFKFQRASKSVARPKVGENFDFYVHEYGTFDGVVVPPNELGIDSPIVANDGFHYRPEITVHKAFK